MIKHVITRYYNYNVKTFTEYVDDKISTYITYDPNGLITHKRTPSTLENYLYGIPHGEIITYYENTNIHLYKLYNMGKLIVEKNYYVTGELVQVKNYNNGELITSKTYHLNGILNFEMKYNHETNSSVRIDYYDNGNIRDITNFINKLVTGNTLRFYPNGNLKEICKYVDYKKNGLRIVLHDNGNIQLVSEYINDIPIPEKTKCFDQNNNPIQITKLHIDTLFHKNFL